MEKKPFILDPEKLEFHSSCAEGLHSFLTDEVKSYKLEILSSNRGGVHFRGRLNQLQRFFLETRFSSRISFVFNRLKAMDAEDLYYGALKLPWEHIITGGKTFKIDSFTKDNLAHSRYALYKLKDAIRDRFRNKLDTEVDVEKDDPDILILLRSSVDNVTIQISLTPHALNKRGYRLDSLDAPIRENVAQGLLAFSGWQPGELLIDPMCGSGTILIEAALLLKTNLNINAKALEKSYIFNQLFSSYKPKQTEYVSRKKIFGFDINTNAIKIAKENAIKAGVEDLIQFQEADFKMLNKSFIDDIGYIVTNPPYGVRIGTLEEIKDLYKAIGKNLKNHFSGYNFTVICGDKSLLGYFQLKADKELSITIAKLKGKFVHYKIK